MSAVGAILGWFGRRAIVYVLLVTALVAAASVVPWIKSEWVGPEKVRTRIDHVNFVLPKMTRANALAQIEFEHRLTAMRSGSVARIETRLGKAKTELNTLIEARPEGWTTLRYLENPYAMLDDHRRELVIKLRQREIESLQKAREFSGLRRELAKLGDLKVRERAAESGRRYCDSARARQAVFETQWIKLRRYLDRNEYRRLKDDTDSRCGQSESAKRLLDAHRKAKESWQKAVDVFEKTTGPFSEAKSLTIGLKKQLREDQATLGGAWRERLRVQAERVDLAGKAWIAAWLLLLAILTPYLIRTVFYYVLAPIAARRPAITMGTQSGASAPSIPLGERSATSIGVRLMPGEELLVRQDYLQSSSSVGGKNTRGLLDYWHPFMSIAAGLVFLTRIRGEGQVTTISAVRDPFAEVALLTLPEGASCVLHPRALAAVAQPTGRPMRITRHWRLTSLNAWLTLQLRYLVFHGPARLAIKGGRGVRIEPAEVGRIFGQDQLIGFSTDLAYSVTRTETFAPYLLGRESLLKDHVVGGEGVLIVEEAPLAGRGRGGTRGGLEGAMDAVLKIFGV